MYRQNASSAFIHHGRRASSRRSESVNRRGVITRPRRRAEPARDPNPSSPTLLKQPSPCPHHRSAGGFEAPFFGARIASVKPSAHHRAGAKSLRRQAKKVVSTAWHAS